MAHMMKDYIVRIVRNGNQEDGCHKKQGGAHIAEVYQGTLEEV